MDVRRLLRVGRLSVQPVTPAQYARIVAMSETAWEPPAKPKPKAKQKKKSASARRRARNRRA